MGELPCSHKESHAGLRSHVDGWVHVTLLHSTHLDYLRSPYRADFPRQGYRSVFRSPALPSRRQRSWPWRMPMSAKQHGTRVAPRRVSGLVQIPNSLIESRYKARKIGIGQAFPNRAAIFARMLRPVRIHHAWLANQMRPRAYTYRALPLLPFHLTALKISTSALTRHRPWSVTRYQTLTGSLTRAQWVLCPEINNRADR